MTKPSKKLTVTCLCPNCGTAVPITKMQAGMALAVGRKQASKEQLSAAGKKGAIKRWGTRSI